jgi:hypothetical protein
MGSPPDVISSMVWRFEITASKVPDENCLAVLLGDFLGG